MRTTSVFVLGLAAMAVATQENEQQAETVPTIIIGIDVGGQPAQGASSTAAATTTAGAGAGVTSTEGKKSQTKTGGAQPTMPASPGGNKNSTMPGGGAGNGNRGGSGGGGNKGSGNSTMPGNGAGGGSNRGGGAGAGRGGAGGNGTTSAPIGTGTGLPGSRPSVPIVSVGSGHVLSASLAGVIGLAMGVTIFM